MASELILLWKCGFGSPFPSPHPSRPRCAQSPFPSPSGRGAGDCSPSPSGRGVRGEGNQSLTAAKAPTGAGSGENDPPTRPLLRRCRQNNRHAQPPRSRCRCLAPPPSKWAPMPLTSVKPSTRTRPWARASAWRPRSPMAVVPICRQPKNNSASNRQTLDTSCTAKVQGVPCLFQRRTHRL